MAQRWYCKYDGDVNRNQNKVEFGHKDRSNGTFVEPPGRHENKFVLKKRLQVLQIGRTVIDYPKVVCANVHQVVFNLVKHTGHRSIFKVLAIICRRHACQVGEGGREVHGLGHKIDQLSLEAGNFQ
jgi:hypothetical protein